MIWLVWLPAAGETEADARRIDAQDCIEAAEEWARRDSAANPEAAQRHLSGGLVLEVLGGANDSYTVEVTAEITLRYSGRVTRRPQPDKEPK